MFYVTLQTEHLCCNINLPELKQKQKRTNQKKRRVKICDTRHKFCPFVYNIMDHLSPRCQHANIFYIFISSGSASRSKRRLGLEILQTTCKHCFWWSRAMSCCCCWLCRGNPLRVRRVDFGSLHCPGACQ